MNLTRFPGTRALVLTILLGIGGSFAAGFVGQALGWYQAGQGAGWIGSIVGALVLLFAVNKFTSGSKPPAQ